MILHAENWFRFVLHPLIGVIVQVHMRNFHFARWQRLRVNAESVILGGNLYLVIQQIHYRMIRAMMPKF